MFAALCRWFGFRGDTDRRFNAVCDLAVPQTATLAPPFPAPAGKTWVLNLDGTRSLHRATPQIAKLRIDTSELSTAIRKMKRKIDRAERKAAKAKPRRRASTKTAKTTKRATRKPARRKSRNRK